MSNGYYTSPTVNWPAPRNKGGYNAQQLAIQKDIQKNVQTFNADLKTFKTFKNAPQFSDHVQEYWGQKITEYSDAQNDFVSGNSSSQESKKSQDDLVELWGQWSKVAPYIASLGEVVKEYGLIGELDKLNDPNLEALLTHMQRNDGSVTLQNHGNRLYLTGKGEIDEINVNGELTGNKLPWEYDLDIEAFLEIIGVNTYEQDPTGTGKIEGAILDNLNKIISRRITAPDMDLNPTIEAAVSQSSTPWKIPVINVGKETSTKTIDFINENELKYNLNFGGIPSGLGRSDFGTTKWVGTPESPSIMNSTSFASYYANVIYPEYQPHYNEDGEIDWLIDYDDNGNEDGRVKPWNLNDEKIWGPTRDRLTNDALKNAASVNQNSMIRLKTNYQEILDNDYKGDFKEFQEKFEGGAILENPFEYYEGTTTTAKADWKKAGEYYMQNNTENNIEPEPEVIKGSVKTAADCDAATQAFDPISQQCVPKARYTITKIFSDWGTLGDNPRDLTINTRVSPEDIINDLNTAPTLVEGTPMTSAEVFASIKGVDGKPLGLIISESNGEMRLFVKNPQGGKWKNRRWKEGSMRGKGKGMVKEVNINFNTDKSIQDLIDKILAELKKVGAQNL